MCVCVTHTCETNAQLCYLACSLSLTRLVLLHQLVALLLLKLADQFWLVLPDQAHLDGTLLAVTALQPRRVTFRQLQNKLYVST